MNYTMAPLFNSAPARVLQSISLGGGGTFDSKLTESVPSPWLSLPPWEEMTVSGRGRGRHAECLQLYRVHPS